MVERQTDRNLKILRSDNGTEFVNNAFDNFLKQNGIIRQLTVPHTPQQNGTAERFNRTIIEMARAMMIGAEVTEWMWAEAVNTAVYVRNRAPTRALENATPFEIWYGKKPTVAHLRTFGIKVVAVDKTQRGKFRARGKEFIMVGYSDTAKAYRLCDPKTKKLIVSRDVYLLEPHAEKQYVSHDIHLIPEQQESSKNENNSEKHSNKEEEFVSAEEDNDEPESTHQSKNENINNLMNGPGRPRIIRSGAPGRPKKQYNMVNMIMCQVPLTVKEAMSGEHAEKWREAMQSEYDALIKNKTWVLTELPEDQNVVGNKWVFSLKRDMNGNVDRLRQGS